MPTVPPTPEAIENAAEILRSGGLVAFPTETVYGLGANALDDEAVARIFEAKRRPAFDPIIVHLSGADQLDLVVREVPPLAQRLVARWWPGPLTIVLPKSTAVGGIVTAGLDTVGVRCPDHPVALALLEAAQLPIAAPSANRFGRLSPTSARHVEKQIGNVVDLIIDGGPTRHGIESTIVSLDGEEVHVLRHGAITSDELEAEGLAVADRSAANAAPIAPGQMSSHYSPHTPLVLGLPDTPIANAGLLAFREARTAGFGAIEVLSPTGDLVVAAARLFEALHRLDAGGVDVIYAEPVPEIGLGRAIMDRLRRAAADAHGRNTWNS